MTHSSHFLQNINIFFKIVCVSFGNTKKSVQFRTLMFFHVFKDFKLVMHKKGWSYQPFLFLGQKRVRVHSPLGE